MTAIATTARDIMMKQWRISDGKLAGEMLGYLKRGLAKDALVSHEAVQYFVDLTRESSNLTQPISAGQVVDFTFLDRARKRVARRKITQERNYARLRRQANSNELREIVDPARTILLVWDMQNDQAGGSFNKDALIRNAPPLIDAAAKARSRPSIHARRHFLWKDEAPRLDRRGMKDQKVDQPSKLKPRRLHGSFGWNIMEPFKPRRKIGDRQAPADDVLGNEFETIMSNLGLTTIVMIGCTTDGGVEAHRAAKVSIAVISW
jgi:hypothetical protein